MKIFKCKDIKDLYVGVNKLDLTQLKKELVCVGVLRTPTQTNNPSEMRNSYKYQFFEFFADKCFILSALCVLAVKGFQNG